jgi:hypothetical protein
MTYCKRVNLLLGYTRTVIDKALNAPRLKFRTFSKNTKILEIYSKSRSNILLGTIIQAGYIESRLNCTSDDKVLQASVINFFKGQEIKPHKHLDIFRKFSKTNEIWFVVRGKFIISIFDFNGQQLESFKVKTGSIFILFDGGHSIKSIRSRSQILEIKNGPYFKSVQDKILL